MSCREVDFYIMYIVGGKRRKRKKKLERGRKIQREVGMCICGR
jgi:hypothetical protein